MNKSYLLGQEKLATTSDSKIIFTLLINQRDIDTTTDAIRELCFLLYNNLC